MHEFSIASGILEIVGEELSRRNLAILHKVTLRLGPLANIEREALATAFELAATATPMAGAALEFEEAELELRCASCGALFSPAGRKTVFAPCPSCGLTEGHAVEKGSEFYIKSIEAE